MNKDFLKSPLNYAGNKYKLLPQIIPLFPKQINTFYDLFGGSGTVLMNVVANNYVYNEINTQIMQLVKYIFSCNCNTELIKINNIIHENNLTKGNKEQFYKFRNKYNEIPSSRDLFILSCFSLNYQIRFNKKNKFNMSCGNRQFSTNMKNNFIKANTFAKSHTITYYNNSYEKFTNFKCNDFIYIDPPYLQTTATYTENNLWNINKEQELYKYLDFLNKINIKWAFSNTLKYRGAVNYVLAKWCDKYNINKLNFSYKNNNLWRKNNTEETIEILITNY